MKTAAEHQRLGLARHLGSGVALDAASREDSSSAAEQQWAHSVILCDSS
jgi:hypothetical protein